MQEMRDTLLASSKSKFEENNNFVMSAIQAMSEKVTETINRYYDASQKAAAAASETITNTAQKDAERAKSANQRLSQLAAQFESEKNALQGAQKFWTLHDENMQRFHGVMENFTATQE